jgi:excinuclease ABC subunit B
MRRAQEETRRRREIQLEYNRVNGITPRTIEKSVEEVLRTTSVADAIGREREEGVRELLAALDQESPEALIARLEAEMLEAAGALEFERAASLRDRIDEVRSTLATAAQMGLGGDVASGQAANVADAHRGNRSRASEPRRMKGRFGRRR